MDRDTARSRSVARRQWGDAADCPQQCAAARPEVPIDNLQTERAIRSIAVGRKNHYGSRSQRGTFVAALFYTLIESAQLVGVSPREYLEEATSRAIANPGTVTLPHSLAAPAAQLAA